MRICHLIFFAWILRISYLLRHSSWIRYSVRIYYIHSKLLFLFFSNWRRFWFLQICSSTIYSFTWVFWIWFRIQIANSIWFELSICSLKRIITTTHTLSIALLFAAMNSALNYDLFQLLNLRIFLRKFLLVEFEFELEVFQHLWIQVLVFCLAGVFGDICLIVRWFVIFMELLTIWWCFAAAVLVYYFDLWLLVSRFFFVLFEFVHLLFQFLNPLVLLQILLFNLFNPLIFFLVLYLKLIHPRPWISLRFDYLLQLLHLRRPLFNDFFI